MNLCLYIVLYQISVLPLCLRFSGSPSVGNLNPGGKTVPCGTTPLCGFLPFGNTIPGGKVKFTGNLNSCGSWPCGFNVNVAALGVDSTKSETSPKNMQ